jgi:hypothetical protein
MAVSSEIKSDEIQAPYGLSYSSREDSVVVAWYYPGVNCQLSGDREEAPSSFVFYSSEYVGARFVRELPVTHPQIAVEAVELRLWPNDPHPGEPGDFMSPFRLAIYDHLPGWVSTAPLWESVVACSTVASAAQWCRFPVQALCTVSSAAYVLIEWLEATPSAPALAVSYTIGADGQWFGTPQGESITWSPLTDMNVHLRMTYSVCDTLGIFAHSEELPDSFSIFMMSIGEATAQPARLVPGTSAMHYVFSRDDIEGKYLSVAAWLGDTLGPKSAAVLIDLMTSVDEQAVQEISHASLLASYPNPFNSETTIVSDSAADIVIVNLLGRNVRRLTASSNADGRNYFRWDGRDSAGKSVSSGIYFCRQTGKSGVLKLIFLK